MRRTLLITTAWVAVAGVGQAQAQTQLGAYTGIPGEAASQAQYQAFTNAVGIPTVLDSFVDQSLPSSQWVTSAQWSAQTQASASWSKAATPVVSVPMGTEEQGNAFAAITSGSLDSVYKGIFQAYADAGYGSFYIRPGPEMNGGWEPWAVTADNVTAYNAVFQHIADLAHSFSGAKIQVVWNPNAGPTAVPLAQLYTGNSAVDVIGIDSYGGQVSPNFAPNAPPTDPGILTVNGALALAKANGKPFALPEVGGNDPTFAKQMGQAIVASGVPTAFVSLWDNNDSAGNLRWDQNPAMVNAWKAMLATIGGAAPAAPAANPPAQGAQAAVASVQPAGAARQIFPGDGGTITDAQGHQWTITESGSITKDGQYVPGGGGTSALTIINGVVYGKDSGHEPVHPGAWFAFDSAGQTWSVSQAPSSATSAQTAASATRSQAEAATATPAIALPVVCGSGVASGAFRTANGRIIGPDGKDFIARGVNLYEEQTGDANALLDTFKGTNFIRLNIHSYKDPSTYAAFVQQMTARGIVVTFEDHPDGGGGQDPAFTGAKLTAELAWYASMAKAYASNPYVWFGTFNEPGTQGGSVSAWEKQTYDAIRGTGNKNPILLEIVGWPGAWGNRLNPADYVAMTNTVWDTHYYGWVSRYSTDQATVDKALADIISQVQQIKSADGTMPAIIAEYGNSTDGTSIDANGVQVVTSVVNLGGQGKVGSAAWHWNPGGNADHLMAGNQPSSPYGQMVQLYIGITTQACTAAEAATNAQNQIAAVTAQLIAADAQPNPGTPAPTTPAPASPDATNPAIAALNQSAEASIAQANAIITGVQQRMQANLATSP